MNEELLSLHPETCPPKRTWIRRHWFLSLAGLGLVAGMIFGPTLVSFGCTFSKPRIVKSIMAYRQSLFPQWAAAHPGLECPRVITELDAFGDRYPDPNDAWGTEYEVICVRGQLWRTIILRSAGPDQTFGTSDDLTTHPLPANGG